MRIPRDMLGRDYDAWFDNGFIYLDDELCTYSHYASGYVYGRNEHGDEVCCEVEDVEFFWPDCGCVNVSSGFAVYVQRRQNRQWRRTYNSREVSVTIPDRWELMKARGAPISTPGEYEIAYAVHRADYPTIVTAETWLDCGMRMSVAISPHVILAGEGNKRIYLRDELVGVLQDGKVVPTAGTSKARRVLKALGGSYGL